jgi:hypothetical protein
MWPTFTAYNGCRDSGNLTSRNITMHAFYRCSDIYYIYVTHPLCRKDELACLYIVSYGLNSWSINGLNMECDR